MKAVFKKAIIFALVVIMGVETMGFALPAQKVSAASAPSMTIGTRSYFLTPDLVSVGYKIENVSDTAKVSVTVDKESIVSPYWDKSTSYVWFYVKKVGSTNVTVKVKQGGKTYKFSGKVKLVKYTNPLKELMVGSNAYKISYYDKKKMSMLKTQTKKKAFTWKLKKGYKIDSIYYIHDGVQTKIKNGQKIMFSSGDRKAQIKMFYTDPNGVQGSLYLYESEKTGPFPY